MMRGISGTVVTSIVGLMIPNMTKEGIKEKTTPPVPEIAEYMEYFSYRRLFGWNGSMGSSLPYRSKLYFESVNPASMEKKIIKKS